MMSRSRQLTLLSPLENAQDVYGYMKSAKVFCLPSVREGFSIVTLESLACGTPVITINSAANAAKKLISDWVNGSIASNTAKDLARHIEYWVNLPQKPNAVSVGSEYDWRSLAQKQVEIYGV